MHLSIDVFIYLSMQHMAVVLLMILEVSVESLDEAQTSRWSPEVLCTIFRYATSM